MNPRPRKAIDTSTYSGRFAERLRMLREKAGMTPMELAQKTGFPKNTHQRWETDTNSPPVNAYPILAKALGVSVRTLLPKE